MATDPDTVTYIVEQAQGAGQVTARKMFGEYGLYCDGKVVGLICDDQLFLKPTPGAQTLLGDTRKAPRYPGAKPHFLIDEGLEDADLLARVIAMIASEIPTPKPKTAKPKTPRKKA